MLTHPTLKIGGKQPFMTKVIGQIESLKSLKRELRLRGITCFNSVGEINAFKENYQTEKLELVREIEEEVNERIASLRKESVLLEEAYIDQKNNLTRALQAEIFQLTASGELISNRKATDPASALINTIKRGYLSAKRGHLERNFDNIIRKRSYQLWARSQKSASVLNHCLENKDCIISRRITSKKRKLEEAKKAIDDLYPLIAGAYGENEVVKELMKLPSGNFLFNDFSIRFTKPIYYKKENDWISSIQIDHLLVTRAGIFAIETKNWSEKSVQKLSLRSPIKQIARCSHALYHLLNVNDDLEEKLNNHHWGAKKIPIRKVVCMLRHKPREEFNYVRVLTLKELNGYIEYFKPVFSEEEVKIISKSLVALLQDL